MKILAIRGSNLASLRGDFELDLAAEPFVSTGLFAITGPTGAGKSTLLDALCLALFDRTPRLDGRGGARVGRADQLDEHRLRSGDVRGMLTRGQAQGFAEVDFASPEGGRWRARWEVRRARDSAYGRLQPQKLTLQDLDSGDFVGDKKTEVLSATQHRIGLSFEQFRRSVLLAQGDFAAFLHSAPTKRAELLEKVTGTEIYARISAAAFERAKAERGVLEGLHQQLSSFGLLSPEERHQTETDLAAASASLAAAKLALDIAAAATQWYAERSKLRQLEGLGNQAVVEASERWQQTQGRRQTLALVKAAQPLRSRLQQQDAATERRDQARQIVADQSDQHQNAQQAMVAAVQQLTAARQVQEQARQEANDMAPDLEQAALLDDRLTAIERDVEAAAATAAAATGKVEQSVHQAAAAAKAVNDEQEKLDTAADWLEKHPHAQALSGAWNHLQAALSDHADALQAAAAYRQELPRLEVAASRASAAAKLASAEAETAVQQLQACQETVETARAAIPEGRREELETERTTRQNYREKLRQAEQALADVQQAHGDQQRAENAAHAARQRHQAALETIEHTRTARHEHDIRFAEASRSLQESQAIRDLAERRTDLVDGEPCPLCGSTTHPFQRHGVPDALAQQKQRVQDLEERGKQLTADLATAEQQAKTHREEATTQAELTTRALARLAAPLESWQQVLGTVRELDLPEGLPETGLPETGLPKTGLPKISLPERGQLEIGLSAVGPETGLPRAGLPQTVLPEDPRSVGAGPALEHAVDQAQQELDDLARKEREFQDLDQAVTARREARDAAREQLDERVESRQQAKASERQAADALSEVQRKLNAEDARLVAAIKSLETSLGARPGWRQQLEADSHAFLATCQQEVSEFREQTAAHEQARTALAELRPQAAKIAAEVAAAKDTATTQEQRWRELEAARDTLRTERSLLLDGQPVADVKRALTQASAAADQALDAAIEIERKARDHSKVAEARHESARQQLHHEATALEKAELDVQAALAEHAIDLATLRQRLQHDVAWCDAETRDLDALQQAVQAAELVLAERRARRDEHETTDPPEISEAEATAQQQTATETHQQASESEQDLRLRIKLDDTARAKRDLIATDIARQEAQTHLWATLTEVIGSHDGGKFRKFAQGLTLDSLLGFANTHLQNLAPRYRLERVPGEDLELQVIDCDMGDDVRSIKSLSGGETFLASLALALGLSSLSASETPVESLFIDEGFGTLDPETLEVALSAFDALQASGHQVGIISHVQDLDQRIGVQVRVIKQGAGRSRLEVVSGP